MARVFGTPGYGARREAAFRIAPVLLMAPLTLVVVSVASVWIHGWRLASSFVFGVLVNLIFDWYRKDGMLQPALEGRHYLKGAEGESRAAAVLAKLPDEFIVFHDYQPIGKDGERAKWNIDHIVVGPTGVFAVETKMYSRRHVASSRTNKWTRKNIKQVKRNAYDLKSALATWSGGELASVFVEAVLVYAQDGAYVEQMYDAGAHVVPVRRLDGEVVRRAKRDVSRDQVYRIAQTLLHQLPVDARVQFAGEIDRMNGDSKALKRQVVKERLVAGAGTPQASAKVAPVDAVPDAEHPSMCPRCGKALVRRTAGRGARAGLPFLGCTGYPGCTFLENIEA